MSNPIYSPDPFISPLKPPQFRLRTMLLGVAGLCVLLSVMVAVGMFWAMGVLMLVLLIGAHVVGNALGTQLRDRSPLVDYDTRDEFGEPVKRAARVKVEPWQAPPAGRMQEKRPLGWLLIGLSLAGAVASGIVGGVSISSLYWDKIGIGAIAMASLASAVIGGMAVFLTGTFLDMVQRVWREATAETKPGQQS